MNWPGCSLTPMPEVDVNMLAELRDIMHSLDRFWGAIEVDINPDFDGNRDEIDFDGIRSRVRDRPRLPVQSRGA